MEIQETMVSVAVITYNHEKYLRRALDSILSQQVNFKLEIVVGEDCSPDNSREILKEYKEKYPDMFRLILRNKNIGPTNNVYDTLNNCQGKYIACLEGDDYWTDPDKLQIQFDFLKNNEEYIGVCCLANQIDETDNVISTFPKIEHIKVINNNIEFCNISDYIELKYKYDSEDFQINTIMYRNIFLKHRNDERVKRLLTTSKYVADVQTKLLLLNSGKIKILDKIVMNYRYITNKGTSFSAQTAVKRFEDIKLAFELGDEYSNLKYHKQINKFIKLKLFIELFELIKTRGGKEINTIVRKNFDFYDYFRFFYYLCHRTIKKIIKEVLN